MATPQTGKAGQYGYTAGAPNLNASVALNLLGDEFYRPLDIENNELGWGTNSRYLGSITTGAGLYGIQGKKSEISKILDIGQTFKQDLAAGRIQSFVDPETGAVSYREFVDSPDGGGFTRDITDRFNTGGEQNYNAQDNFAKWRDTTEKLQTAASTLGIDTRNMTDRQILDAVNAADKRVAVTGRTQFWDKNQAGIGGEEGPQHATVVYSQQGELLRPVAPPQTFNFQDPKTSGNVFTQLVREGLMIPPFMAALGAYAFGPGGLLSPAEAGGTGLLPGAGGVTGLTPGAAGVTGLTPSAGFVLAPEIGAAVGATPSFSLLDTTQFPNLPPDMGGGTGITPNAAGQGLQLPTSPNLSSMGGGQGLTIPVEGGTISAMGLTPAGATPALGSPSSFINNPNVIGQPVIQQGTPSSFISPSEAVRALNTVRQLTGGGQQQPASQDMAQGGMQQPVGVDYSGLLSLLAAQARTTGLLGTQYQPAPVNLASLLG